MDITSVTGRFDVQKIQSEAEVRSKLVVPLLECLGYPEEMRAEEFPVYSYQGGKKNSTKSADFLLFKDNEFAQNREGRPEQIGWVHEQSLLVVETKKPTVNIEEDQIGQALFYSAWTRSAAYIVTNGVQIRCFLLNLNGNDVKVIDCPVDELPQSWSEMTPISYTELVKRKNKVNTQNDKSKEIKYGQYIERKFSELCIELHNSLPRSFKESEPSLFPIALTQDAKVFKMDDIINDDNKVVTSEPGGGKSYLLRMIAKMQLMKNDKEKGKIPVLLLGKNYYRNYQDLLEGIYLQIHSYEPSVSLSCVKTDVEQGKFLILFDGVDEIYKDIDLIEDELLQIATSTQNTLIVTSRHYNYRGNLNRRFSHYELKPLEDQQIEQYLSEVTGQDLRLYSLNISNKLYSLIRTPLFLYILSQIIKDDEKHLLPNNETNMFQTFVDHSIHKPQMNIKPFEAASAKLILSKYALATFNIGENHTVLVNTIKEVAGEMQIQRYLEIFEASGLLVHVGQGLAFFHMAFQEYFAALEVSSSKENEILDFISENHNKDKYIETICFLSGLVSNKEEQNNILKLLLSINLRLFIKALRARYRFSTIVELDGKTFTEDYFSLIRDAYSQFIQTHFNQMKFMFEGYRNFDLENTELCVEGKMNLSNGDIRIKFYRDNLDQSTVRTEITGRLAPVMRLANTGEEIPVISYRFNRGGDVEHGYNLIRNELGYSSQWEIAVDIAKVQIFEIIKKKEALDFGIPLLMSERLEIELKRLKKHGVMWEKRERLSLYKTSLQELKKIIEPYKGLQAINYDYKLCWEMLDLLIDAQIEVRDLLEVLPDLTLAPERKKYHVTELHSEKQTEKKVQHVLGQSIQAYRGIIELHFYTFKECFRYYDGYRPIAWITGKGQYKNVYYIYVESTGDLEPKVYTIPPNTPEEDRDIMQSNLDALGYKIDIKNYDYQHSILSLFFMTNVFHDFVYDMIQGDFKELFRK